MLHKPLELMFRASNMIRIVMALFLVFSSFACNDGGSGRKRGPNAGRDGNPEVTLPAKGTKVALVFPAGAGAMRTCLTITEQFETDLGVSDLASIIDAAGGVSSGSLLAAAMSAGKPSKDIKRDLGAFVRDVFADANNLIDKLVNTYHFTLEDLEAIFAELMKNPPDMSNIAAAKTGFADILVKSAAVQVGIARKIAAVGTTDDFVLAIEPDLMKMLPQGPKNAAALEAAITKVIGNVPLSDPTASKFIAYASHDKKPAFFGGPTFATFVKDPFAIPATKLHDALIASSAIPGFITAPPITFNLPGGGTAVYNDLIDGVFATPGRFDPSATLYDVYTKMFANEDLLIVFIGNGAEYDGDFRSMLRTKYGMRNKIAQQTLANGKKVTFTAIDATIVNDKNKSLFNLSGFYDSPDLAKYMDKAGKAAVKSPAYKWALDAIKASKQ